MATYISENPIIIRQFFCLKYWPWMELGIWTSRSDPSATSPLQSALFQENLKLENIILILSNMQFCLNLESRNSLKVVYRKWYELGVSVKETSLKWTTLRLSGWSKVKVDGPNWLVRSEPFGAFRVMASLIRIKLSSTLAPFNRPFLTNYALLSISYGPYDMDLTRFTVRTSIFRVVNTIESQNFPQGVLGKDPS